MGNAFAMFERCARRSQTAQPHTDLTAAELRSIGTNLPTEATNSQEYISQSDTGVEGHGRFEMQPTVTTPPTVPEGYYDCG